MKITLCGSMTFHKEMKSFVRELEQLGYTAIAPQLRMDKQNEQEEGRASIREFIEREGGTENFPQTHLVWKEKARATDDHFNLIEKSDAILVANYPKHSIEGYVGGNTLMEIAIARYLKKKIFILFAPSSQLTTKEEILGVLPIILNNDISRIS